MKIAGSPSFEIFEGCCGCSDGEGHWSWCPGCLPLCLDDLTPQEREDFLNEQSRLAADERDSVELQ